MPPMSDNSQIIDLEVRVAYQERLIGQLDEVIRELATRMERVENELAELRDSTDAEPIGPQDERPPHY